ncbi:MAG TPA: peptidyl-prolyl cis-trans isomerase [Elusimicrobia bacterium]|nr:peptidyl-prolyl cis-trans isomerase [Elusimicrobiota bacterium]HBT60968.1 peptidyl-prolyl cis-trans isomerase [Elusimicrobiota bacterium]
MRRGACLAVAVLALGATACGRKSDGKAGKFAIIETSMGVIKVELFVDKTPLTAAHFIGLATGQKPWRDPRTGKQRSDPVYDGVPFHRVIPGFMIQTGDPMGDGRGDVGVAVKDEIVPGLSFDKPGMVGMASFGPDTNASQFFITVGPGPDLTGRQTLFGRVAEGLDVAVAISKVPRDEHESSNRPLKPVWIKRLRIVERLD